MAVRTVSVQLEVKAAEARKSIRVTASDLDKLLRTSKETGRSLDDMAAEAKQAGRKLDDMAADARASTRQLDAMAEKAHKAQRGLEGTAAGAKVAKRETSAYERELASLDRQIDATIVHLKVLGREFAATGNKALLKGISADRSMLRRLQAVRKDITPGSPDLGDGVGVLSRTGVGPPLIAAAIGLAAMAAPGIGAIIGGAVIGGAGAGGIVGGIIAASQDGRVQDAFSGLGHRLKGAFASTGQPFLGPLLHEVNDIEVLALSAMNILRKGFADLAPVLRPVVLGFQGFVDALGPGLGDAFKAAKPLLRAFANELPRIGAAISDAFSDMASASDGGVEGMIALTRAFEGFIRGVGAFVHAMEVTYAWLVRNTHAAAEFGLTLVDAFPALTPLAGKLHDIADQTQGYMDAANAAKDSSNDFALSLDGTGTSAEAAAQAVKDLNDAVDNLLRNQLTWDQAQIRLRQGFRDLVKELTTGKRTLAENSVEGDKNRAAIEQQIGVVIDAAEAYRDLTGDVAGANKMRDAELDKIRTELIQLGYNKKAVDDLINAYKNAPAKVATEYQAPGLKDAQSRLNKVEDLLNRLDGRAIKTTITQEFIQYRHDEVASSRRWGGISEHEAGAIQHAAMGRLRDAAIYRPPTRYAFAEPETGGEAFVPRRGSYARSMGILSAAAGWYGASVVPHMGAVRAPAGAMTIGVVLSAAPGVDSSVVRAMMPYLRAEIRTDVRSGGGDVQSHYGSRPWANSARTIN